MTPRKKDRATEEPKRPRGRPTSYTEELAATICTRIADGESLRTICADEGMPDRVTVFRWIARHEAFRIQYMLAREDQADTIVDEILDIADDGTNDWMLRNRGEETAWVENGEAIRRSQLRIDARKWVAGQLRPKKYGNKVTVGGDSESPIHHKHELDAERFTRAIAGLATRSGEAEGD